MKNLLIFFCLIFILSCGGSSDNPNGDETNNDEGAPPPGESINALTADWTCHRSFNHEICNGVDTVFGIDDSEMETDDFINTVFDSKGCTMSPVQDLNDEIMFEGTSCKKGADRKFTIHSEDSGEDSGCIYEDNTDANLKISADLQTIEGTFQIKWSVDDKDNRSNSCELIPERFEHCTLYFDINCTRLSAQEKADLVEERRERECRYGGYYDPPAWCTQRH